MIKDDILELWVCCFDYVSRWNPVEAATFKTALGRISHVLIFIPWGAAWFVLMAALMLIMPPLAIVSYILYGGDK